MVNNSSDLETLHDYIWAQLDSPAKKGIRRLLGQNNQSFKKTLYPHLALYGVDDVAGLMSAIDLLLDVHSKECYTIGHLDCLKSVESEKNRVANFNKNQ